jgi:O-antigen ligase
LLQALITRAEAAPTAAIAGWHAPRNPYASYSGVWTFDDAQQAADIGWLRDSRLNFSFSGREVGLLLRKDNVLATLYPTLDDGKFANALPRDGAGRNFITLTSATLTAERGPVAVARSLPEGTHNLQVIADQGFDRYALLGFAVGASDIASPYNALVNGSWVALMIALAAVLFSGRGLPWSAWYSRAAWLWTRARTPLQWGLGIVTSLLLMVGVLMTWGQDPPALIRREALAGLIGLLSGGLIYLNPWLPVTLIAVTVLFWVIYHRPIIGLCLTIGFAPFFLFPVELWRFALPMSELLLLLTFGAWLLRMLVGWAARVRSGLPRQKITLSAADWLILAYGLLGLAALSWSAVRDAALTDFRTLFVEPILFYVMARAVIRSARDRSLLVGALITAGALTAGISLFQYTRGEGIITAEDLSMRLAGVYGSPNNLALFLGRCIPFALPALLVSRGLWQKLAGVFLLALMLIAAALTQSVGGLFIGIPAAFVVVLLVMFGRRSLPWLAGALIVGVATFAVLGATSERFSRALDFTQGTNFYRIRVMQSALQIIEDHPLTGLGLDQFLYAFRDRYLYPDAWQEPNLSHPHNMLLDFWVRLGILGVPLIAALLWVTVRAYRSGLAVSRWQAAAGLGALANIVSHGMLDNSVFVVDLMLVFMLVMALAQSLRNSAVTSLSGDMVD